MKDSSSPSGKRWEVNTDEAVIGHFKIEVQLPGDCKQHQTYIISTYY